MQRQLPDMPLGRAVVRDRAGRLVFRIAGKAGADLKTAPMAAWADQQEAAFLALNARCERLMQFGEVRSAAVASRVARGQAVKVVIRQLAAQHAHRGRDLASFVASKVERTARYVRQVLAEKAEVTEIERFP